MMISQYLLKAFQVKEEPVKPYVILVTLEEVNYSWISQYKVRGPLEYT